MRQGLCFLLICGIVFSQCDGPPVEDKPKKELKELTLTEGTNMAVALSPSGDTLAYDLLGRIWLMPVSGGEGIPITDPYGNAREPSWSPDGKKIAFQAYWDGNWHIYTVNTDGTGIKQMTSGEFDHREPHWSPDGTTLAFSSDRNGNYDIWTLQIVSEQMVPVTSADGNESGPSWSPDGKELAYVKEMDGNFELVKRSAISGASTSLYTASGKLTGASWSPDGNQLLINEHKDVTATLKQVDAESQEVKTVSSEGEDVFPFRHSWMSDGSLIYTASGNMYQLSAQGEKQTIPFSVKVELDRTPYQRKKRDFDDAAPQLAKGIVYPSISPDGESVLFVALQDLWIKTGPDLVQLTDDAAVQWLPIWSPDGQQIAYSSDKDGSFGIWTMDADGSDANKVLATGSSVSGMTWSPDGKTIAFTKSYGPRFGTLNLLDLATGEQKRLGAGVGSSVGTPTWSPDGKIVALSALAPYSTRYREGVNRVMLFSVDGGRQRVQKAPEHWSFGVRANDGPVWSPDGEYMALISKGRLWMMPVDSFGNSTGDPIQLTEEMADAPTWSGDSKKLLYMATDQLKVLNVDTKIAEKIALHLTWERKHAQGRTIIHAGGLIDAVSDTLKQDIDIVIDGHRIVEIAAHDESREADQKIDASDAFVMPGLIDIHVHEGSENGERLGRTWLSWGVTTIRNPAGDPYDALNRREAMQSGKALGPRIYFTGSPIDGNRIFYGGASTTTSEQQVDEELRKAELLDYDLIKTYVRLPDVLQKRVVDGAHRIGIPVTSHELYPAVGFNIDGVEHVKGTSRRGYSAKLSETRQAYDDVTNLLAESGMWFTPTTAIYLGYQYVVARDPSVMEDARLQELTELRYLASISASAEQIQSDQETYDELYENVIRMVADVHRKGGLVVAGTDAPIIPQGFGLHVELENYQDAGLRPIDVLRTATINNAKALNAQDDLGTIEVGKLADLVIVEGNPLEDIRNARKTRMVIKNGEVFELERLIKGE
ncbi:MAG: amidohydrolase family protein [Cytophagales bacterium]|nr:amidohydrolase family protein [Cytophagales bacterium]